jgi:hypothetical protein
MFLYYLAVLAVLLTQHLKESLITFMESDNISSRDIQEGRFKDRILILGTGALMMASYVLRLIEVKKARMVQQQSKAVVEPDMPGRSVM